jgi:hypothetical protein
MFPSFLGSGDGVREWNVAHAAAYGAGIGLLAALFKTFAPVRGAGAAGTTLWELAGAAVAFALLCVGAAALRNFLIRRFIERP